MSDSYIQLPSDSGNTGKKLLAQSRVVGANTVYSHYFVPVTPVNIKSVYCCSSFFNVAASANNGTTSSIFWFQNPLDSLVTARVRKITFFQSTFATADAATSPRFLLSQFTHIGGWSGSLLICGRRKLSEPYNQCDVRTASTGTTVTLGNPMWTFCSSGFDITTSGTLAVACQSNYQPINEDEFIEVSPGNGLVLWQADAGTASQASIIVSFVWDEYDNT